MAKKGEKKAVKTAGTIFGIINVLQEEEGAATTDVANRLGMANSTIHEHLTTLEQMNYLVKEDSEYHLGLKFLKHGITAKGRLPVAEIARPTVEHLAEKTEESVILFVEEHGQAVYIDKVEGERAVPARGSIGSRSPMHCIAGGKAILAYLPAERVEEIIERHGLVRQTEKTITDPDELFDALEEIRNRGFAFNKGESTDGIRAIGAPIQNDGEIIGSLSVTGPRNRFRNEYFSKTLPDLLLGSANEIELKLRH